MEFPELIEAVGQRQTMVKTYLNENGISFSYKHLEDAVYSYVNAGGKALRSAVMMFCCGAVGGDEQTAVPAAAAIELYHTFTLVHDDIIDRDELRRGVPTVHVDFAARGRHELGLQDEAADHYGLALAILAGDMQQGWAASLFPDLYHRYGLPAELALNLIRELFHKTQVALINGETVDVLQAQTPVDQITEADVLEMLRQKTGVLYEFAGRSGTAIGLKTSDLHHPTVEALANFTALCGTAFQIQDDVLGIVGSEKQLGKPIGSDIREGKRTVIVLNSLQQMSPAEREFTLSVLGNHNATANDVHKLIALLKSTGGVDYAHQLARDYINRALKYLDQIPDSPYKELLRTWARYIVEREL